MGGRGRKSETWGLSLTNPFTLIISFSSPPPPPPSSQASGQKGQESELSGWRKEERVINIVIISAANFAARAGFSLFTRKKEKIVSSFAFFAGKMRPLAQKEEKAEKEEWKKLAMQQGRRRLTWLPFSSFVFALL